MTTPATEARPPLRLDRELYRSAKEHIDSSPALKEMYGRLKKDIIDWISKPPTYCTEYPFNLGVVNLTLLDVASKNALYTRLVWNLRKRGIVCDVKRSPWKSGAIGVKVIHPQIQVNAPLDDETSEGWTNKPNVLSPPQIETFKLLIDKITHDLHQTYFVVINRDELGPHTYDYLTRHFEPKGIKVREYGQNQLTISL